MITIIPCINTCVYAMPCQAAFEQMLSMNARITLCICSNGRSRRLARYFTEQKQLKYMYWREKKVSIRGATLHWTYRGFQQCFLVCSTDAQNVAPVGNQLLHPLNIVIWAIPCSQVWGRHNCLTASTKCKCVLHWHIPYLLATYMEQSRFQILAKILQALTSHSRFWLVLRVIYLCSKVLPRYSSKRIHKRPWNNPPSF